MAEVTWKLLLLIYFSHFLLFPSTGAGSHNSVTFDLIHRDSPASPVHNPKESQKDRLYNAFHRSNLRLNAFKAAASASPSDPQSAMMPGIAEYYMNISIGTQPVPAMVIADTGSDLIWVQCMACEQCYDQALPMFDPSKSSTFQSISCKSQPCNDLPTAGTCDLNSNCRYSYSYADNSFTNGILSSETLTFGSAAGGSSPISFHNLTFGCGRNNSFSYKQHASGLVGLGGGPLSLVSQLAATANISKQFSYCLTPMFQDNAKSKITFGNSGRLSNGPTVASTPLVTKDPKTFYYLTLESVRVGDQTLPYGNSSVKQGNIIIDSGTTLTYLNIDFYNQLASAITDSVSGSATRVQDPNNVFSLCFVAEDSYKFPTITVHFTGADVKLEAENAFLKLGEQSGQKVVCFIMEPVDADFAIFGNLAQVNMLVGYDLVGETVSFMPTDCNAGNWLGPSNTIFLCLFVLLAFFKV